MVVNCGVMFELFVGVVVEGYLVIYEDVVIDDCCFINNDVYVVVDEELVFNCCFWMDFNVGDVVR